jgi:cation diffusion facilitator family transporter
VARRHRSQALEADALHFSTDVWSSAVVIAGLAAVRASEALGLPWLARADAVAALGVAFIAVVVSVRLGRKAVDDLLDAAPAGLLERVAHASAIPGVIEVAQVRVRQSGPATFADVTVHVARGLTFEAAHAFAHDAEAAIRAAVEGIDVVVHVEPADPEKARPAGVGAGGPGSGSTGAVP